MTWHHFIRWTKNAWQAYVAYTQKIWMERLWNVDVNGIEL